jgi:hypothetical protein
MGVSKKDARTTSDNQYIQIAPITMPTNIPPTTIVFQEEYDRLRSRANRLEAMERKFNQLEQTTSLSTAKDLLLVLFSLLISEVARTPLGQMTLGIVAAAIVSFAALVVLLYLYYAGLRRAHNTGRR